LGWCCQWEEERRRQEEDKAPVNRKQRRKGNGFPQGPMCKYRKLQGSECKTKFPVDLKPKWRNAQNESWRVFQALQPCFRAQIQKLKIYTFTRESLNKSRIWIAFVLEM
jgi:hypothetical protein